MNETPPNKTTTPSPAAPAGFCLGLLVATLGALESLQRCSQTAAELLDRHRSGDWGDLNAEDIQANNHALVEGERLLSSYSLNDGCKLWIITEADRSSTCVLLPDEY